MQQLSIANAYLWSKYQPDRKMNFNGHFFVFESGNVAVDPVSLDGDDLDQIASLGGVAWVIITNKDHVRDSAVLCERFGAKIAASEADAPQLGLKVDRFINDGDEIFPGGIAVMLEHQKTAGEFAIHLREANVVLVGDAILGSPAGGLSLLPDRAYVDISKATLGLRRIWALQPKVLLVGDGAPLWSDATQAIGKLLFERGGIAVNRINLDELRFERSSTEGGKYDSEDGEVGFWIGAERLGYQVVKLPPGARFCPVHAELSEEELFIVLDGAPSIRTQSETLQCRQGDFIAFPTGLRHAHQVINESSSPATLLLLGESKIDAVCYYPESEKILVSTPHARWMVRNAPQLDYYDGE